MENLKLLAGFLAFSAVIALIGFMLGVFDYDVAEDGQIIMEYQSPSGERRF
ncbi:MAG: hypothetical protein KDK05_28250 [Candidatus Competibacteraceae bacterium]|nr:hypothetical protein [Candidatus Competibacteraceae bacterium]